MRRVYVEVLWSLQFVLACLLDRMSLAADKANVNVCESVSSSPAAQTRRSLDFHWLAVKQIHGTWLSFFFLFFFLGVLPGSLTGTYLPASSCSRRTPHLSGVLCICLMAKMPKRRHKGKQSTRMNVKKYKNDETYIESVLKKKSSIHWKILMAVFFFFNKCV